MGESKFTKDYTKIADEILCGVDYDIYKDDCNEMDNECRDEIESRLRDEFSIIEMMYEKLSYFASDDFEFNEGSEYHADEINKILSKARGESK